jgi:hypothetical protein
MPFYGTQNISVLHVQMKFVVTPNGIRKVDLAIALNRTPVMTKLLLCHPRRGSTSMA